MDLSFAEVKYSPETTYTPASAPARVVNKNSSKELHIRLKNISKLVKENHILQVGWFKSAVYPNGQLVGDVAYAQEYGFTTEMPNGKSATVPPRPFVRPAKKNNSKKWKQIINAGVADAVKNGNGDLMPTFDKLGFKVSGDIKRAIKNVYYPPLSDYTIEQRMKARGITDFSSLSMAQTGELVKPLEDTGKMISSVEFHTSKG